MTIKVINTIVNSMMLIFSAVMCNCAYYKINFTGLLKILIKLHKISAKYYKNNNMEIWVCNRCAYFTCKFHTL